MNILFKRERSGGFKLWAKIELDEEETTLAKKYHLYDTVLVDIPQPGLVQSSFVLWGFLTLCFFVLLTFFGHKLGIRFPWVLDLCLSTLLAGFIAFLRYHQKRETIYVKDLVHGRHFSCRSVIALARKEAYLQYITTYFRQVLESAKHWEGAESITIVPLPPEEAKRSILSGPFLE